MSTTTTEEQAAEATKDDSIEQGQPEEAAAAVGEGQQQVSYQSQNYETSLTNNVVDLAASANAEASVVEAAAVESTVEAAVAAVAAENAAATTESVVMETVHVEENVEEIAAPEATVETESAEPAAAMETEAPVEAANTDTAAAAATPPTAEVADKDTIGEAIVEPTELDVLNGRGASVNAHKGNQRFRSLCFQRKPEFDAGNHAVKRRIATEIVGITKSLPGRFLKKRSKQGPWFELTTEKSILKACQVMRDFRRPDRVALREMARMNARKRQRTKPPSTPMPDTPIPTEPLEPIIENPFGVHDHDVLSGRGAYVNGHVGNQRFRQLAQERKVQFDNGNYSEKRSLATEIVGIIRSLDPPGRFLKRVNTRDLPPPEPEAEAIADAPPRVLDGSWEELTDDKAIHKACQVMRDIDRPDRGPDGVIREKRGRGQTPEEISNEGAEASDEQVAPEHPEVVAPEQPEDVSEQQAAARDSIAMLAETTTADSAAVKEAVAAAEAALDKVMDGVQNVPPPAARTSLDTEEEAVARANAGVTAVQAAEAAAAAIVNTGEGENAVIEPVDV